MGKVDYIFAVFTRGRVDTQIFIEDLPPMMRQLITIVCHPGEREAHLRRWGGKVADVIEYGRDCSYLGEGRDWLMAYCRKHGIRYAIQIDDNVRFASHSDGRVIDFALPLKNIRNNFGEDEQMFIYFEMFWWMVDALRSGYGMCGISHRSGNNRKRNATDENTRLFAVWGIDVDKYYDTGAKFADNPFKEDFHMELAMLTNGIPIISNNCFTFEKAHGANQSGGCSTYRNQDNVDYGALLLKEAYPRFVNVVDKANSNWQNMGGKETRKECIVAWKKAYESATKKD